MYFERIRPTIFGFCRDIRQDLKKQRGFTLIELVAVVSMIGTLAALAIPQFSHMMQDRKVQRAAWEVADMFRAARMNSIGRGSAVLVQWTNSGDQGTLTIREAVEGVSNFLPTSSCMITWDNTNSRVLSSINFATYNITKIDFYADTSGTNGDALEICFSPGGRTYFRTSSSAEFAAMNQVASSKVTNTRTSVVRTIFIPSTGAARLQL